MARLAVVMARATSIMVGTREFSYFGGCGYLGLAHHPRVIEAAASGLRRYGISSGAARETSGNATVHDELEAEVARRLGTEAALLAPEGYTANFVAAQALAEECDVALIDDASHASLFDAAAASEIEVLSWPHGDLAAARTLARSVQGRRAVWMTDSVFPSLGEAAPLDELASLAAQAGDALLVDDGHGTGVLGRRGLGALERWGLDGTRVVLTSTFSKALGTYGGFVAGDRTLIDGARRRSAVYLGTTPIPPALALAGLAALELAFDTAELVDRMRANSAALRGAFEHLGLPVPREDLPVFAFALETRARMDALDLDLRSRGFLAPLVRYPGGPEAGNFRVVVNAAHTLDEVGRFAEALGQGLRSVR
jgi:7-keto-8-aminopelargonate synthetase-like enzyme